jgi:hypothetical protein
MICCSPSNYLPMGYLPTYLPTHGLPTYTPPTKLPMGYLLIYLPTHGLPIYLFVGYLLTYLSGIRVTYRAIKNLLGGLCRVILRII